MDPRPPATIYYVEVSECGMLRDESSLSQVFRLLWLACSRRIDGRSVAAGPQRWRGQRWRGLRLLLPWRLSPLLATHRRRRISSFSLLMVRALPLLPTRRQQSPVVVLTVVAVRRRNGVGVRLRLE